MEPPAQRTEAAIFTRGAPMRHVAVMSLTGAAGLSFMFLIELGTLFWVSRLGEERLVAALGFVWTVQFFLIATGIGLGTATTALVSRSLGRGALENARAEATGALIISFAVMSLLAGALMVWRHPILAAIGATGQTAEIAARYLAMTLPAMGLLGLGMTGSAVLRARADAYRAMTVTMSAGLVTLVLDPLLILGLGLGIDGAAVAMVVARVASAALSIFYILRIHGMLIWPRLTPSLRLLAPFFAIAVPAVATQLATPFGNYVVTMLIAAFGDGAVAGWSVVARVMVFGFAGLFTLSASIGGIFGQNYGAGRLDRIRRAYRDAALFCLAYTGIVWAVLWLVEGALVAAFRLGPDGAAVMSAFVMLGAPAYLFTGLLFVANAAFNTLGRPLWSTAFNWLRDGLVLWPLAWALAQVLAAPGVIYGQAAAGGVVGLLALWAGWRFVLGLEPDRRLESRARPLDVQPDRIP